MPQSAVPVWQRVLWELYEQRQAHPDSPFLRPVEIARALGLPLKDPGVHTNLLRLAKQKLVSRRRSGGRSKYLITSLGVHSVEQAPSPRPWRSGTPIATGSARYRIVEPLRPLDRPPSARVEVFKATIQSATGPRIDRGLSVDGRVVIKTIPNHQLEHLRSVDDSVRATYIEELNRVFTSETQKLESAPNFSRVARTLDWGLEPLLVPGRRRLKLPFVVQEFIEGPDLPAFLAGAYGSPFTGMTSLEDWFELAESLAEGLKQVHASGAYHRHIWPGTIFMRPDGPVFVDLIEAAFHVPSWPEGAGAAPPSEDFGARTPGRTETAPVSLDANAFVAPEWRVDRRLEPRRTADLYSLGAVLFYAATGRSPDFVSTDREGLKKAVVQALQGSIGADNYGVADIISRCLRFDVDDRVSDTYTLLSDIRLFRGSHRTPRVEDVLGLVSRVNKITVSQSGDVFGSLAAVELEQFERAISELETGSLTVGEGHDNLVVKLCSYLSTLGKGDEYWAVTVPDFWRPDNLGVRGRYLSMNAEIVRRGAKVFRVFLLTDDDLRKVEVLAIVKAHRELERELTQRGARVEGTLDLRYQRVSESKREELVRSGKQYGLWVRRESLVQVKAIYNSKGTINRVTIRRLESDRKSMKASWFDEFFEKAPPLKLWGS
jgi:serine/threonine protein kinase